MFSAELSIWFYCVQENGFLGVSENSRKNHRKSTHPKDQYTRSGARGQPRGPRRLAGAAPPLAAPGGRLGGSSPLWCPTLPPIYSRARKPQNRSCFPNSRRGAAATLCSSPGGLIWRLFWPPMRGDHRHPHHHHHSILPP